MERLTAETAPEPGQPARLQASDSPLDEGDISQIRSMLERTPSERLERLQDFVDGVVALRDGRAESQ
jgi:hypothetical protein